MCTVSYLPNQNHSFTLTSNRDELTNRQSDSPQIYIFKNKRIVFPKDKIIFGSWMAASEARAICLLNGGFEAHHRKNNYRLSRGTVVLDALVIKDIVEFEQHYSLSDIEPFTMVWIDLEPNKLYELVWDGKVLFKKCLDEKQAHFWSSSTLYNAEWRVKRKQWFELWLQQNISDANAIRDFHLFGGEKNKSHGFIMSRNNGALKTISVTQILYHQDVVMRHLDLIDQVTYEMAL